MNDYMKGTIDACFELAGTPLEAVHFLQKATGLTDKGIVKNKYIQQKLKEMRREA